MKSKLFILGAAIVSLAGSIAFLSFSSSPQEAADNGVEEAPKKAANSDKRNGKQFFDSIGAVASDVSVENEAERAVEQWKVMAEKFNSATSLRAFFYEAIQKPEQGGYFYAMAALNRCRDIKKISPVDVASPQERAAYEMNAKCDFSEQEARDAFQQFGAIRSVNLDEDPLLRQMFAFTRAKTEAEQVAVLASTLDTGNPQAIRSAITPAVEKSLRSKLGTDADSSALAEFSLDLVECQLGASCGEKSNRALELCAKNGWCADSVPNALRLGLGTHFSTVSLESSEVFKNLSTRNFRLLIPDA